MKEALLLALLAAALAGCADDAQPQIVTMQNPKTGDTIHCRLDPPRMTERPQVKNCVDGYAAAGWVAISGKQPIE